MTNSPDGKRLPPRSPRISQRLAPRLNLNRQWITHQPYNFDDGKGPTSPIRIIIHSSEVAVMSLYDMNHIYLYISNQSKLYTYYIYMNIIKYTSIMNQLIFILFMILIKQITISTPFSAEMTPSACWKPFTSSSETKDSKDSPRLADRRAVKQKMKIYDENNWEYHAMNNMYIEGWLTWKISLSNWIAEYMGYDYILKYHWISWYP